jgi:hypothetical protein
LCGSLPDRPGPSPDLGPHRYCHLILGRGPRAKAGRFDQPRGSKVSLKKAQPYAAAAMALRKPSISVCRLVVEFDNCLADDSSWFDAAPV